MNRLMSFKVLRFNLHSFGHSSDNGSGLLSTTTEPGLTIITSIYSYIDSRYIMYFGT